MKSHDKRLLLSYGRGGLAEKISSVFTVENSANPLNTEKLSGVLDKRIWRIDDVAHFLGCSKGHVYNLSSDEKIPKIKKGKFLYFIPSEILEWLLKGDFHD